MFRRPESAAAVARAAITLVIVLLAPAMVAEGRAGETVPSSCIVSAGDLCVSLVTNKAYEDYACINEVGQPPQCDHCCEHTGDICITQAGDHSDYWDLSC